MQYRPTEHWVIQGLTIVVQADEVGQGGHAAPVVEAVLDGNAYRDQDEPREEHESRS